MTLPSQVTAEISRRDFVKTLTLATAGVAMLPEVRAQNAAPEVALALVGGAHIHAPGYLEQQFKYIVMPVNGL